MPCRAAAPPAASVVATLFPSPEPSISTVLVVGVEGPLRRYRKNNATIATNKQPGSDRQGRIAAPGNRALFEQMNQADADRQQKQQRQRDGRRNPTSNVRKHPNVHPEPECGHRAHVATPADRATLFASSLAINSPTDCAARTPENLPEP
jgi:hypothetical protein